MKTIKILLASAIVIAFFHPAAAESDFSAWPYMREIPVPAQFKGVVRIRLDEETLSKMRPNQGDLRVRQLFNLVRVRYMEAEEIDRFDPEHLSFFNINDEADLERRRG